MGGPGAVAADGRRGRPGFRSTLGIATAAALSRPAMWPLALVAFLLRGGILLFALPFVVLPTPVGLGTVLGPVLFRLFVGQPDLRAAVLVGGVVALVVVWLVVGGFVAAACEVILVRWSATDLAAWAGDDVTRRPVADPDATGRGAFRPAGRALAVRVVAHVPFALGLAWLLPLVVAVAYAELESPTDVSTPLAWRVLPRVAGPSCVVGLAWVVGQVLGALAVRALVLDGRGVTQALGAGARSMLRHPLSTMAAWGLGAVGLVVLVVPALVAAVAAWEQVRRSLPDGTWSTAALGSVVLLVATWIGGAFLAAVGSAWRGTWWTAEWLRHADPVTVPADTALARPEAARASS